MTFPCRYMYHRDGNVVRNADGLEISRLRNELCVGDVVDCLRLIANQTLSSNLLRALHDHARPAESVSCRDWYCRGTLCRHTPVQWCA